MPVLAAVAMTALADETADPKYFVIVDKSSTEHVFDAATIQVTIADGFATAVDASQNQTFAMTDVTAFYFTNTPLGVDKIAVDETMPIDVYDLGGIYLGRYTSMSEIAKAVPAGRTVIVKQGANAIKTVVK